MSLPSAGLYPYVGWFAWCLAAGWMVTQELRAFGSPELEGNVRFCKDDEVCCLTVEGGRLSIWVDTASTYAPAPGLGPQLSWSTAWWPEAWPPQQCPRWPVSPAMTADGCKFQQSIMVFPYS